jgi:hypothetical protein
MPLQPATKLSEAMVPGTDPRPRPIDPAIQQLLYQDTFSEEIIITS